MISIGKTLSSRAVFEDAFCCDLSRCKGACCIEGDAGAPLSKDEVQVLKGIYPSVKPYLRPEGIAAIEEQGTSVIDSDGEDVTPLVEGKECAFVTFSDKGVAQCGIEQAHTAGDIDFIKPLSCHLYPIRVSQFSQYDALNVHQWDLCAPACELGKSLKLPVFRFLKDPLVRAFGQGWIDEAELVHEALSRENDKTE